MLSVIFATNNPNKIAEIQSAIGDQIRVITLMEAGIDIDIPEPHPTLEENASEKSKTIHALTSLNCFSEDTGLEVKSLNGEPGVLSARYAGEEKSFEKNIDKLLANLDATTDRSARFRTVISLIWEGKEYLFEGICEGSITTERHGGNGFGYDPVFLPSGTNRTFAEMSLDEKNQVSHRKKAADKLVEFLKKQGS
ncbi:MAG TPA: RdgB/HAM1 family non-canonical purine NTP pyrophosphatase [Flavitalea sp.]|nr:RdgB/HAM1 family non-canonical purine NTP pyrophosphatase [Flavitalea sp.]